MRKFIPILLDVWREACRHIEISEFVTRMAPILAHRLPSDLLLIRRLDVQRQWVETAACGPSDTAGVSRQTRRECKSDDFQQVIQWCRGGNVLRDTVGNVVGMFPALLPNGLDGHVLAAPLSSEHEPTGALVLVSKSRGPFLVEHETLVAALAEPFTVALENDRRIRELSNLREAVEADNRALLSRLGRQDISDSVVGAESGLRTVMERVELVAGSDAAVLLLGETGSGKEVVAREIHKRSNRTSGPFVRVNCGAIPPELVDSELFGHERGSFTGAVAERKGWFERADGGTLFLDEVGELPLAAQVRLLRVLQDGYLERVGGQRQLHVDVRVIAATNRDLRASVSEGVFREDLWYRIAVFIIRIPALRERIEDIPKLAAHFALRAASRLGLAPHVPSSHENDLLVSYSWPGNVRELAAVVERAAILGNGKRLDVAAALGATVQIAPPSAEIQPTPTINHSDATGQFPTLDDTMIKHIESALLRTHGRVEGPHGAARLLGVNPHTLRARMRKLGIDAKRFRSANF